MSKDPTYHSSNISDPHVYHDYNRCPTGKQIPARNWRRGTNGYRRCEDCIEIENKGG